MNTRLLGRMLIVFGALMTGLLVTGCTSTGPDNLSTRPWNSPKGWEGGVPGMLYDRR